MNQRWWKEAEKLQIQVMQMSKRLLGEEHPDALVNMANLALTLLSQGQHDQAIPLMQNAVNLQTKILGLNHPTTTKSINALEQWCR